MRLIEVARILGITGQELRHELAEVDFGVKPTDREVPERIAQGILRYIANKRGIELKMPGESLEEATQREESAKSDAAASEEEVVTEGKLKNGGEESEKSPSVHVLRKLTLEDVSDADVKAHIRRAAPARRSRRPTQIGERGKRRGPKHAVQEQIKKKEGVVDLPAAITVKEFAEKTGIQVPAIVSALMKNGVMASINQSIDFDTAAIIAEDLGVQVRRMQTEASAENLIAGNLEELLKEEDTSLLLPRPAIVTVMGHVDHGKTAILDAIRKTDIVSGEAGGITQSIGATQVEHEGQSITFIDTPGHEAFTAMRARGAQVTDLVVLVVAADEGIKPTTVEAISHAREAKVPIIVALNKIDRENADPDRVKGELAGHELQPEEWGGTTPLVPCSAVTGQGITDLLDTILLVAETEALKANPNRAAIATVIESHLDSSLGPVASIIVNTGTLHLGDSVVCGATFGRIKSLHDAHGVLMKEVLPSGAARIAGLSAVPATGDILQVVRDDHEARHILEKIEEARAAKRDRGLGDLITRLSEGKMQILKIVLKADSQGEIEALRGALHQLESNAKEGGVLPKIIHAAVGNISESDVMMAAASDGIVFGFNVLLPTRVEEIAQKNQVKVQLYDVIYKLLDDVEGLLAGLVESVEEERITGHLEVRGLFFRKRSEQVIGGKVTDGMLKRLPFRLQRDGTFIGAGRITNLKHVEKDVKEAKEGQEYGLRVECDTEIQERDILEAYVKEWRKKR